jgi:hypothetical protein
MNNIQIDSFSEFHKKLNENFEPNKEVEEDKAVWNDKRAKIKTQTQKIRIVLGVPDSSQGELIRYEFKFVNQEDIDPATAKQSALGGIEGLITDQIAKNAITSNMVGFIETKRDEKRLVGDYLFKGVLSFYDKSRFRNLGNAAVQPIKSIPIPTAKPVAETTNDLPLTSKVVLAEDAGTDQNVIKIYDFTAMKDLGAPGESPMVDANSLLNMVQKRVPEPAKPEVNPEDKPASMVGPQPTTSTPAAPVVPAAPTAKAPTNSYEGLTKNLAINPLIKDLQAKIILKGATDPKIKPAADLLNAIGKADGKYGDATAKAIAQLVTGNQQVPITNIDKATSDKLNALLTDVDPNALATMIGNQQVVAPVAHPIKTSNPKVPTLYF